MIIRVVQLLAFAIICAPLLYGVATFDALAVLQASGSLSVRADEFIRSQKETGTSMWNEVSLTTPLPSTSVLGTQHYNTPCFSITIPFEHTLEQTQNQNACVIKAMLKPRGRLAIQASETIDPLQEQTAVRIRLQNPEQFSQVPSTAYSFEESRQFIESDTATLFLRSNRYTLSIAVTGIANPAAFSFDPIVSTLEMSE